MNVVMFFVSLTLSIALGAVIGKFVGNWLGKKYLSIKGYSFIKQEELANLVNERNFYRYGLKHGFSLEEVEKAIKEARA